MGQNPVHSSLNPNAQEFTLEPVFTPTIVQQKQISTEQTFTESLPLVGVKLFTQEQVLLAKQQIKANSGTIIQELEALQKRATAKKKPLLALPTDSANLVLIKEAVAINETLSIKEQLKTMLAAVKAIKKDKTIQ